MLDLAGILGATLLLGGLAIATIGLIGLLRRREIFEQLHAAGLVTGPGVVLVLLASIGTTRAEIITSAVLVVAFVLITSSLSTHAIAWAAWRRRQAGAAPAALASAGSAAAGPEVAAEAVEARAASPASTGVMRVLVAIDGSLEARVAAQLVAALPLPPGSDVRLLVVTEGDLPDLNDTGRRLPRARAGDGAAATLEAALDEARRAITQPGVDVDRVARTGRPAAVIVREASDCRASLIVIGSRGLGRVRAVLTGSVAAEVVERAPCPVLVARTTSVKEVLLAVDGTPVSAPPIEAVGRWPIFEGARIRVASVGGAEATRIAEAAAAELRARGRDAVAAAGRGAPTQAILGLAAAAPTDLIVLGSRGHVGLRRAIFGSVAAEVLRSARTSVLVVRARDGG